MTTDQVLLFCILLGFFALLLWGRFRYDLVAFGALVAALLTGAVPTDEAFAGFGHSATVIIALVLIVSKGLSNSGAIDLIARYTVSATRGLKAHIGIMASVAAALSGVMNNVAALALLMPIDLQAASKARRSAALTLMPLSFATILGGMVTMIGTPPNIVIATFRENALGAPFGMFDFAPVGLIVAVVGVLYVALIGWRLLPAERTKADVREGLQELEGYTFEGRVLEGSEAIGKRLRELYPGADEDGVSVVGLMRNDQRLRGSARDEKVAEGDLIIVEGGPEPVVEFFAGLGLEHAGAAPPGLLAGETMSLIEVVVPAGARMEGRTARDLQLAYRHGVSLLGVSRQGRRFRSRVVRQTIRAGDILLLLGPEERMRSIVTWMGCLPLEGRDLKVPRKNRAALAIGIFAAAIVLASVGVLYLTVALAAAVVLYVALGLVPVRRVYESVEWPVIVLLGSLIPIGVALETSGGTALLAETILRWTEGLPPAAILVVLMVVTMTLSDVLNNVATALIAAPIGVDIARGLEVSPDPFLMAVAVASSCAFLTPIGHKNNTIVMGPGGYRFGDYWRMGLPLELLVLLVGVPMILFFWPM